MDQRNLLLAIVLSVGILIGFNTCSRRSGRLPTANPASFKSDWADANRSRCARNNDPRDRAPGHGCSRNSPATGAARAETREEAIAEQPRVRINTPRLHGSSR